MDENIPQSGVGDIKRLILHSESKPYSKLKRSWHFLQVYSVWGLRLPATEIELKSALYITDPGLFKFFPLMQNGNTELKNNCQYFQEQVFPQVLFLARNLLDYSKLGTPAGENFFGFIINLLEENKFDDALDIVKELRDNSSSSFEQSVAVHENLSRFFSELTKGKAILDHCHEEIEKQDETSSKTINAASGKKEVKGSLAYLQEEVNLLLESYYHAKTVALTTLSYAWVPFIGTVVAAIVAGIYGSGATNLLNAYYEALAILEATNQKYWTAVSIRNTLILSNNQLKYILYATEKAISQTDIVRNAWSGIVGSLGILSKKVNSMISQKDEVEVLKAKKIVIAYCIESGKQWTSMIEPLTDLVTDPYIRVEEGIKNLNEFIGDLEREVQKLE